MLSRGVLCWLAGTEERAFASSSCGQFGCVESWDPPSQLQSNPVLELACDAVARVGWIFLVRDVMCSSTPHCTLKVKCDCILCNVWYRLVTFLCVSFCMAYLSFIIYWFIFVFFFCFVLFLFLYGLIRWVWPGFGVVSVNFRGPGARPCWQAVSRVELSAWSVVFRLSSLSDPSAESVSSVMSQGWDNV